MGILRRDEPDQTPDEFWSQIEEKHGGKVTFFTFSKFVGRSRTEIGNMPGLIYVVNDVLYFEDFEKDNMLAKLINRKRNYEKTEFSFQLSNVEQIKKVTQGNAIRCISGLIADQEIPPISWFHKIFTNPVYQIILDNGESVFFEQVMNDKAFIKIFSRN